MAVEPGTREVRRRAAGVGEACVTLSWHPQCILQARGQVACEKQVFHGRRDHWLRRPRLPRGPCRRATAVSRVLPGLLGSLLGDLPGSAYFQNSFAVGLEGYFTVFYVTKVYVTE